MPDGGGFRVLVTGSSSWEDGYTIFDVLNEILGEQGTPLTVMIHGDGTRGACKITKMWCEVHPAGMIGMKTGGKWEDGPPHLCVAFLMPCEQEGCPQRGLHWSHGAYGCVEYARAKGVPVRTLETVRF
jgi:hypothetical protein